MRAEFQGRADHSAIPNVVPYIASWSAESRPLEQVVLLSGLRGIGYEDEVLYDRDKHGILWNRSSLAPGQGRPNFGSVHTARQRRTMRQMLCQVCAGPPDRNDQGVLWLLGNDRGDWPNWPEKMAATHPPLCLPCAALSLRLCPYLRKGCVAVRVREPQVGGIYGLLYRPGPEGPEPVISDVVQYGDVRLPWMLASQLAMKLQGCTFIDLDAELSAAGIPLDPADGDLFVPTLAR
jgi:hypothetical protein